MMKRHHEYSALYIPDEKMTVSKVFLRLLRHPSYFLLRRWNWKSAVLSCLVRGGIFFAINIISGFRAATYAMLLEISFISITAGFYGALLQAFRKAKPDWAASVTLMVLLPAIHHTLELFIHSFGGTKKLYASILASISFSALSAYFNLFTMRRGILIVGKHKQPFLQDLRQLPNVILVFLLFIPKAGQHFFRNLIGQIQLSQSSQGSIIEQSEIVKPADGTLNSE
jgi:hypothetical protein